MIIKTEDGVFMTARTINFWILPSAHILLTWSVLGCRQETSFKGRQIQERLSKTAAASPVTAPKLSIEPETITVKEGQKATFKAYLTAQGKDHLDVSDSVTWSVQDTNMGKSEGMQPGQYLGKTSGSTKINATIDKLTALAELKIEPIPVVDFSIKISPGPLTLPIGSTSNLIATAHYVNDEKVVITDKVAWSIDAPTIATIGDSAEVKGQLKTLAAGKAIITVTFSGKVSTTELVVDADPIKFLDPAKQTGKKISVCFSYDKVKIGGHSCNRAQFKVSFFDLEKGEINLNNSSTSGNSVEGGKFESAWDKEGSFSMATKCALQSCHKDVAFMSVIGEVVDIDGKTKWLKIEQGRITPDKAYKYSFKDFTFSEKALEFGALCSIAEH